MCSSGAKRTSAYTTPSAARSWAHSEATRIERVLRLHHGHGVGERLEVEHEVLAGGARGEPRRQLRFVEAWAGASYPVSRASSMTVRGTQAAVEVVVEQHLGRPADLLDRDGLPHRLTVPGTRPAPVVGADARR